MPSLVRSEKGVRVLQTAPIMPRWRNGRRAWFKLRFRKEWGFKSLPGHQNKHVLAKILVFSINTCMELNEYISQPKATRQEHLNLDEPCVERGGNSTQHRGVLVEFLNTPFYSRPIDLCHACHNAKCSNPRHLYWGTRKENIQDSIDNGTHVNPWQGLVNKYGLEEARKMQAKGDKSKGGRGNKGKPKSAEHRQKISNSLRARGENGDTRES